jgi:hypothetical protein
MATITSKDIQGMVGHWLDTPVGAYLGSNYGQDAKAPLQRPQADGVPEAFIQKMRQDIPALQTLPAGALNLYSVRTPPDRVDLFIDVAGTAIQVPGR